MFMVGLTYFAPLQASKTTSVGVAILLDASNPTYPGALYLLNMCTWVESEEDSCNDVCAESSEICLPLKENCDEDFTGNCRCCSYPEDIEPFYESEGVGEVSCESELYYSGDINLDGNIDCTDLDMIGDQVTTGANYYPCGDVNEDGNYDTDDYTHFQSHYGITTCSCGIEECY